MKIPKTGHSVFRFKWTPITIVLSFPYFLLTPFLVQLASSLLEPHSSNSVTDDDDDNEINLFLAFLT